MKTLLKTFRDAYLEMLLRFLWREWSALGVAGQEKAPLHHVVDPEALLLFTCTLGRYDQRLFDEVMDWLIENGRFLNVQRMRNILHQEAFGGGEVLGAVGDWLSQCGEPLKWKLLAKMGNPKAKRETLFYLPDGRPMPQSAENDATFLKHGFIRSPLVPRGYSISFPADATPCRLLRMRALFGVNARCDVLMYLSMNKMGHPREVARELYYSQKAIHDVMTDMARSGLVHSARLARERTFRIASDGLSFLTGGSDTPGWINWAVLLSMAETVWRKIDELHAAELDPLVESSEIVLLMKPLLDRLVRAHWAPTIPVIHPREGIALLQTFRVIFETAVA